MKACLNAIAALALLVPGAAASAQRMDPVPTVAGPLIGPVESAHRITIGGQPVAYRAVFRE